MFLFETRNAKMAPNEDFGETTDEKSGIDCFTSLPEEDVLFCRILVLLSLEELFRLKVVCKFFNEIIKYFLDSSFCFELDFSRVGSRKLFTGDVLLRIFKNKTNLLQLNLSSCKHWLKDEHFLFIIKNNIDLKSLSIPECYNISNEALLEIGSHLCKLNSLNLSNSRSLMPETLSFIGTNIKSLVSLDISGCWNITDSCIEEIALNNKGLKDFTSTSCYSLTDLSISTLGRSCTNLETLNIKGCWRVTNQSIFIINEYCKKLKKLYVKECTKINEISIACMRPRGIEIDVPAPVKYLSYRSSPMVQT